MWRASSVEESLCNLQHALLFRRNIALTYVLLNIATLHTGYASKFLIIPVLDVMAYSFISHHPNSRQTLRSKVSTLCHIREGQDPELYICAFTYVMKIRGYWEKVIWVIEMYLPIWKLVYSITCNWYNKYKCHGFIFSTVSASSLFLP